MASPLPRQSRTRPGAGAGAGREPGPGRGAGVGAAEAPTEARAGSQPWGPPTSLGLLREGPAAPGHPYPQVTSRVPHTCAPTPRTSKHTQEKSQLLTVLQRRHEEATKLPCQTCDLSASTATEGHTRKSVSDQQGVGFQSKPLLPGSQGLASLRNRTSKTKDEPCPAWEHHTWVQVRKWVPGGQVQGQLGSHLLLDLCPHLDRTSCSCSPRRGHPESPSRPCTNAQSCMGCGARWAAEGVSTAPCKVLREQRVQKENPHTLGSSDRPSRAIRRGCALAT